ncbi:hypothetical protein IMCC3317_18270 [Kordia antarctica]|uniref:RiboL-PSP-HEPN domain-containing protein n=1 Tax=Kordia antarctica TaxID=1218801 RepID=A0A7L4ZKL3_9FLAO|nr:HEPN domain-containing protein [Kordia antarctica]QHI36464.1 hypothetical protein IMCC3317_18270 [Kordia antarctica]
MNIRRSNAFLILKEHSQSTLNFSVLVCTAVPQLEYAFQQNDTDSSTHLVENSEFRNSTIPYSTEKENLDKYKTVLGANILLSNFSFFESYFFSLIDEIIEFHGGKEEYLAFIETKVAQNGNLELEDKKNLHRLRKEYVKKDKDRYIKFTNIIKDKPIVWPSQKLALYGLKQMIKNKNRWKSADIPNLITDLLTYNLSTEHKDKFHSYRDDRNKIAHGKTLSYSLDKALKGNEFLYNLAKEIDKHVITNYMIIEKHR